MKYLMPRSSPDVGLRGSRAVPTFEERNTEVIKEPRRQAEATWAREAAKKDQSLPTVEWARAAWN
jgi:hypothetical protein